VSSRRFQPAVTKARRDVNPNGVARASGRPLQGRNNLLPSLSVGFTHGYSRFPASREANRRFDGRLILALMKFHLWLLTVFPLRGTGQRSNLFESHWSNQWLTLELQNYTGFEAKYMAL
jgi:hypothetical protein